MLILIPHEGGAGRTGLLCYVLHLLPRGNGGKVVRFICHVLRWLVLETRDREWGWL
jgi:hypothetical protein